MLFKILKADLLNKKVITSILFLFIMLGAFLVSSSSIMTVELINSLKRFFIRSNAPHFVQMNDGKINQQSIRRWAKKNSLVEKQQIVEMLRIDRSNIYLGNSTESEKNTVMNMDFVTQNASFDFLTNLKGEVVHPSPSEIAVPLYFQQKNHLKIGDKVRIASKRLNKTLTIVDFIRDVQMNPSIIHSKRFLINPNDFNDIKLHHNQFVYLIEFQISDLKKLSLFINNYQSSHLPKNGPSISYPYYKILNSVTDGIAISMIILISILLTLISVLCLRFMLIITIEEEYKQIGLMKAIGIQSYNIKAFYLMKYILVAGLACTAGYLLSLFFKKLFIAHMTLYMGRAPETFFNIWAPFSAFLIFCLVIVSCLLVLRKFNKITAIQALRNSVIEKPTFKRHLSINKNKYFNVNILLGLKDVLQRSKTYLLLFFVFLICSFVMILPVNFFNTIKSPSFITYMGIGKSDVRIDLRQTSAGDERFKNVINHIKNDKEVKQYSPFITSGFKVINSEGSLDQINIETGDFSIFPLKYLKGSAPANSNEIALSYLNSKEFKKKVGDRLSIIMNKKKKPMRVTGIYQDITNGGKTAKAKFIYPADDILWYVINVDFKPYVNLNQKVNEYSKRFYPARVTSLDDYLAQTLDDLIKQIKTLTVLAGVIAIFIAVLITSFFLKTIVMKHYPQIAVMKAIGFSLRDIRIQYLTKALIVLNLGILFGGILAGTLGQKIISLMGTFMGASEIKLIIHPVSTYVACPLVLILVVSLTTFVSSTCIKKFNIAQTIAE